MNELESKVVDVLRTCYDPEIPVNIYELGLVYKVEADAAAGNVYIQMTLTTPHCPAAASLPNHIQEKVKAIDGVNDVKLDLVWDPPWKPDMMTEAARLQLGFF